MISSLSRYFDGRVRQHINSRAVSGHWISNWPAEIELHHASLDQGITQKELRTGLSRNISKGPRYVTSAMISNWPSVGCITKRSHDSKCHFRDGSMIVDIQTAHSQLLPPAC